MQLNEILTTTWLCNERRSIYSAYSKVFNSQARPRTQTPEGDASGATPANRRRNKYHLVLPS